MADRSCPKHVQIYEAIAEAIAAGKYAPGQQLPTDVVLMRTFRASRPTVAHAMQRLAAEKLVDRRAGAGTFVRRIDTAATKLFGLIIPGLSVKELMQAICGHMARAAEADHSTLLWGDSLDRPGDAIGSRALELAERYVRMKVAGVFFAPVEYAVGKDAANRRVAEHCSKAGIPVVLIDRDIETYPARSCYDVVGIDNRRAMCMLVAQLLKQRASRIEFFARPLSASTVSLRIAGYRDALRDSGVDPSPRDIHFGDPEDRAFVKRVFATRRDWTVVCANDLTAARLIDTLDQLGVKVPRDGRVAGFDDVAYAHLFRVPLTTVRQPAQAIGMAAVRAMLERLSTPDLPGRDVLLPTQVVLRRSTATDRK